MQTVRLSRTVCKTVLQNPANQLCRTTREVKGKPRPMDRAAAKKIQVGRPTDRWTNLLLTLFRWDSAPAKAPAEVPIA